MKTLTAEQKQRYERELAEAYKLLSEAACDMACVRRREYAPEPWWHLIEPEKAADKATKAMGILSLVARWAEADEERAREAAGTVDNGGAQS